MSINLKLKKEFRIPQVEEELYENTSTANLGLGLVVSFYSMVFYSLYTAYKRHGKIGSAVLTKGKKNFTISQAFYDSEKSISMFFNLLYACIGLYICYRKNMFQANYKRILIIFSFVLIPYLYAQLLFIGPSRALHYFIALLIFGISIYTVTSVYDVYTKYYYDNEDYILNTYYQLMLVIYVFGVLLAIIFLYYLLKILFFPKFKLSQPNKIFGWFITDLLSISEYIIIILYGIVIYIFSIFPALPKN